MSDVNSVTPTESYNISWDGDNWSADAEIAETDFETSGETAATAEASATITVSIDYLPAGEAESTSDDPAAYAGPADSGETGDANPSDTSETTGDEGSEIEPATAEQTVKEEGASDDLAEDAGPADSGETGDANPSDTSETTSGEASEVEPATAEQTVKAEGTSAAPASDTDLAYSGETSDANPSDTSETTIGEVSDQESVTEGQTLKDAAGQSGRLFGAAVDSNLISSNPKYAAVLAEQFNSVTAGNEMKWESIHPGQNEWNFEPADKIVEFAQENGMNVRGHTLVWHNQAPDWVNSLKGEELGTAMENHITETVEHFKGDVTSWDVVNEPLADGDSGENGYRTSHFYNELGEDYIARAFYAADAADPNAELVLNEYNVAGMNDKSDNLYELVKSLKEEGVPIDAVGIQAHFSADDGNWPTADEIQQNLQRFADLGVDIHITELDVGQKSGAEEQKQTYHDYVEAFASNPAVKSITTWGVGDSDSWRAEESPLLYDENYEAKPAYYGVLEALNS
ncbi:MAG: endo-1,4-beta-xylanase [Desulfobacteraceae bacterium]|jgi:endo-1,4-beta-xylanase